MVVCKVPPILSVHLQFIQVVAGQVSLGTMPQLWYRKLRHSMVCSNFSSVALPGPNEGSGVSRALHRLHLLYSSVSPTLMHLKMHAYSSPRNRCWNQPNNPGDWLPQSPQRRSGVIAGTPLVVLGTPHATHDALEHSHLVAPLLNLQLARAQLRRVHLKHACETRRQQAAPEQALNASESHSSVLREKSQLARGAGETGKSAHA